MLRRFYVSLILLLLSSILPIMTNSADASPNVRMHIYHITRIICPGGYVGHSYTTEYETYKITWNHPLPTYEFRTEIEDGTGFEYTVSEEVHTGHSIRGYRVNFITKKRDRYHWSCR